MRVSLLSVRLSTMRVCTLRAEFAIVFRAGRHCVGQLRLLVTLQQRCACGSGNFVGNGAEEEFAIGDVPFMRIFSLNIW